MLQLTARQEECLRLTRLMTDRQIAAHLGVSEATVKKHVLEACRRLGVNRRKAGLAILEAVDQDTPPDLAVLDDAGPLYTALDGPEHEVPDDADPDTETGRFGYRPPPRGGLKRVAMIGLATVVSALVLGVVTDLVASYHYRVGAIDAATRDGLADSVTLSDDAA